ncbi:MAG: MFS transporter [Planctomycetota bacterium]|jgi:MFS family permease|nr:MFS transporter [Planctomycetota bacterium]
MTYDGPYMSLYVETLYHNDPAVSSVAGVESRVFGITGTINAIASAIAIGGAISISYLMDRKVPLWTWALIALGSVCGVWWIYNFASIPGLTAGRSIFLFFSSGLSSVLVVLLSRMTPPEKQGSAMGWSVAARSAGWITAPLLGGSLAIHAGYTDAYWWLGVMTLALAVYFPWLASRHKSVFARGPDKKDRDNVFDEVILPPQSMPVTARASARFFPGEEKNGKN